jgi:hypothetical protein
MLCNGNQSEFCGGPSRLDVYDYQLGAPVSTSAGPVASTTGPVASTTGPSGSTPTGPTQPAAVGNWLWYGCQTEATNMRALSATTFAADTMTLEACAAFCSGYTYFGVEYARECYCGNSFNQGSIPALSTDCSFTCAGNANEYCGAGNRLSAYVINGTAVPSHSEFHAWRPSNGQDS